MNRKLATLVFIGLLGYVGFTSAAPILVRFDVIADRAAWTTVRSIGTQLVNLANAQIATLDATQPIAPPTTPPPPTPPPPTSGTKVIQDITTSAEYFRTTSAGSYLNPNISFVVNLKNFWQTNAQKPGHGLAIFLRYQSEYHTYVAYYNQISGNTVVKKKCLGGTTNGGTYYNLGAFTYNPMPLNRDVAIRATITNEGSNVRINVYRDNVLVATGLDTGQGCARITSTGKVGLRSDSANVSFKNFYVR